MAKTGGGIWIVVALVVTLLVPACWGFDAYQQAYAAARFQMPAPGALSHAAGEASYYRSVKPRGPGGLILRTPHGPLYLYCEWTTGGPSTCTRDLHARGVRDGDRLGVDYFTFRTASGFDIKIIAAVRRDGLVLISHAKREREIVQSAGYSSDRAIMGGLAAAGLAVALLIWAVLAARTLRP